MVFSILGVTVAVLATDTLEDLAPVPGGSRQVVNDPDDIHMVAQRRHLGCMAPWAGRGKLRSLIL